MHRTQRRCLLLVAGFILLAAILAGCSIGESNEISEQGDKVSNAAHKQDVEQDNDGTEQSHSDIGSSRQEEAALSGGKSDGQPVDETGNQTKGAEESSASPDAQTAADSNEQPAANGKGDSGSPAGAAGGVAKGEETDKEGTRSSSVETVPSGGTSKSAGQAASGSSEKPSSGTVKTPKPADSAAPPNSETGRAGSTATEPSQAAGDKDTKSSAARKQDTVNFTIVGPSDVGDILKTTEVKIEKNDTVLDVLKRVTRANKIHMEFRGRGATAYIEGIDNIYEFDYGSGSGWMYNINGKYPNRGAGVWSVKAGDKIEWRYTEDLGKDLGVEMGGLWDGKEE
ncbi:DUF4430 domain-containing protein [Paenibacillus sp. GCM10012307]|uniref:DUF4430 domain-containing protein n=1 Tax=Paenibacillus roseus TaxID=2798579 RepID=A0A934J7K4_9BACL|nr:DUF4430 domain-containing protein [Paenibacillus roseus]MBJ6361867.1 DUF4430 domain-containing protein [Paenibacillus roseus]